jgi:hypothetical protein
MTDDSKHLIEWKEWQKGDDYFVAEAIDKICLSTKWECAGEEVGKARLRTGFSAEGK